MNRLFQLHGLPDDVLMHALKGREVLSDLFEFKLQILSPTPALNLKALLGAQVSVEIEQTQAPRYLGGLITHMQRIGRTSHPPRYYIYEAVLRPWLWFATQTRDYRIFQEKSVVDILQEVLGEYGFPLELRLLERYRKWTYCVQYGETDFDFLSRLMEHEGIYYWFDHEAGKHTLVIADESGAHKAVRGLADIPYYSHTTLINPLEEYIHLWQPRRSLTSTGFAATDYDLNKPQARLDVKQRAAQKDMQGLDLERYEPIGHYTEPEDGERYARVRMQALQVPRHTINAQGNARALAPGHTFALNHHPDSAQDRDYLIVQAEYDFVQAPYHSVAMQTRDSAASQPPENATAAAWDRKAAVPIDQARLDIRIQAIPASTQYRKEVTTPVPQTSGPQTARVVGPDGESIWTDHYGRIKVQFHWDRYGQKNEQSSCWIRVSSPWAGGGFGGLQIPRVNEEVIIDFIGGHPDRPLCVGRVYNAENMPPVNLPDDATKSGFHTRSKDGSPDMANQVMFEDNPGSELLNMIAQKDMATRVKNNSNHLVGAMSTTNILGTHAWNYGGLFNKLVTGDTTYQHESSHCFSVAGNSTDTVTQRQSRSVTGVNTQTVGGAESLTVSGEPALHSYNQGLVRTIHSHKTDTITGSTIRNYSAGEKTTVSGSYAKQVAGGETVLKGDNFKVDAGGNYSLTASGSFEAYGLSKVSIKAGGLTRETTIMQSVNPIVSHVQDINFAIGVNLLRSSASDSSNTNVILKLGAGGLYDSAQMASIKLVGAQVKLVNNSVAMNLASIAITGVNMSVGSTTRPHIFRFEL